MMKKLLNILFFIYDPFDNKFSDITYGVFLGLFAVAWLFLIGTTIIRIKEFDPITIIRIFSLFGISIGVYIAIWKLVHDHKWRQSEVYLEQAKELFEKSYLSFKIDPTTKYPINDRYVWLTASRLLLAAKELGDKIMDISHKETFNEYTEYWRVNFIELLDFDGIKSPSKDYFYENGALHTYTTGQREPLAENSISVIYRFMQWPKEKDDRLEKESNFSEKEITRMEVFGAKGLAEYCRELRK